MKIGFIGLGNMGKPMALNLLKDGHEVIGFDTVPTNLEGLTMATSAADAAIGVDFVITMLPNGEILQSVAGKVLETMARGAALLDCSTVDVDSTRSVARWAEAKGIVPIDAPVSGGIGGASDGTLTFMVGGSEAVSYTHLTLPTTNSV